MEIKRISTELDLNFENFTKGDLNSPSNNREVFVDISDAAHQEMVFVKALQDQPKKILIVIPEWKELNFFDIHSAIHDADGFLI